MSTEPSKLTRFAPLAGAAALALAATTGCLPASGDTGDAGGAVPCAPAGQSQEGAGPEHPERAPLQAEAAFPGGVRWAVCGADPVNGSELLNLRSDDGGETWTVTDTGIAFTPFHAGDDIEIELLEGGYGTIRVSSGVGEFLRFSTTDDGGRTWVLV